MVVKERANFDIERNLYFQFIRRPDNTTFPSGIPVLSGHPRIGLSGQPNKKWPFSKPICFRRSQLTIIDLQPAQYTGIDENFGLPDLF
jgi:hypothetical protein